MPHRRPLRAAALVAVAILASACADVTAPAVQPADLNQVLAELQPASVAGVHSALSPAPVTGLAAPVPSSCSYDATAKSFTCPNVTVSGVTVSRRFTLYDASGNAQSSFDRASTAAVRMQTSFTGTVASGGTTMALDQRQDYTLSGLLTGVHTLDGTSLGHVTGTVSNGSTSTPITSTITTTTTGLVLPRSSTGADRFPAGGTIAALTETTIGALPTITTSVLVAFDGTSRAAVTITTGGRTTRCTIDLTRESATLCSV